MNQYKGIPTRDSTRESKMQMQECTTRRLCQQTEIMLGSEGCVMMLYLAAQSGITGKVSCSTDSTRSTGPVCRDIFVTFLRSYILHFYRRVWSVLCRGSGPDGGVQCGALGAAAWRAPGGRRRRKAGVLAMSESRGRVWRAR